MRIASQCFGPDELAMALHLAKRLRYVGPFADLNTAPALDAFPLLARCMAELGAPRGMPYISGIVRYVPGDHRPAHIDPSPARSMAHHRVIVLLQKASDGGELVVGGLRARLEVGDGVVFRADEEIHEVTRVAVGERYGLTCGVLL